MVAGHKQRVPYSLEGLHASSKRIVPACRPVRTCNAIFVYNAAMSPDDAVFCPECGYNLHGIPEHRCPECGFGFDQSAVRELADIYAVAKLAVYQQVTTCSLFAIGVIFLAGHRLIGLSMSGLRSWLIVPAALFLGLLYTVWRGDSVWTVLCWAAALGVWFFPDAAPLLAGGLVCLAAYRLTRLRAVPPFTTLSVRPERSRQVLRSSTIAFISLGAAGLILMFRLV
ncbi:MAG: zinc ribbon domain-containing protein [bacterium]|nr:zinc ribbon domain-containing protein [bacterium]